MKMYFFLIVILMAVAVITPAAEFIGQFDDTLVPYTRIEEILALDLARKPGLRMESSPGAAARLWKTRILNPAEDYAEKKAVLVEDGSADPYLYIDLNNDNRAAANEKFTFRRVTRANSTLYRWTVTVNFPVRRGPFSNCPVRINYFKADRSATGTNGFQMLVQSTGVFARGSVGINGRKVLVQYLYDFATRKIDPENGWLGVDTDGDGEIDMDDLSPEAANAAGERIVFRAGDIYVSTKRADPAKNLIVLLEHQAADYRRIELAVGKELSDFSFVDMSGKTRRLSEFRGKYVLLNFWGFWCPPCLEEMPYLRQAYRRFQNRNLEIIGMNTDLDTLASIQKNLADNRITWTQARGDSTEDLLNIRLRIESFPSTFLISPDGKILSMSRTERDEPDLHGRSLLDTLDEILPETGR